MQADLLQGFFLGELLVEPLKGEVRSGAGSAHLPPKAAEVLLRLAQEPGEVVERKALLESVWGPGRGSAEALSHAVADIRHALGDRADNPRYIQTLPRRGYRLIVPPKPAASNAAPAAPELPPGDTLPQLPLFENLKRRGVIETAVAYMVTGWLMIQIADVVFDQLLLPQWAGTFVTVLVIAGFPIALLLSWFLELRDGRAYLDTRPDAVTPARRIGRAYLSVISAMLVASVGVFFYDRLVGLPEEERVTSASLEAALALPPVRENSIAVLPLFNIDGSDQTQVFAYGLAEDVINRLATIPGLAVASRGDSWSLPPNSASADVRRRLRVAYYLEGSVRITDGILRVVVQLVDSESGFHLVSRDFERELADFMEVQREVTQLTVANLRVALPDETESIYDFQIDNADVDAYILYRRGKDSFDRPRTRETLATAVGFYERSLSIDPGFAAAHAGLCNAYVAIFDVTSDAADIERAESACAAALLTNPNLHVVYTAFGDLYMATARVAKAQEAYEAALRISAQNAEAIRGLAQVYRREQRYEDAEHLLLRAIDLQPGNWRTLNAFGSLLFNLGRYQEAAEAFGQVASLDQENFQALGNMGSALILAGQFERGRVVLEKALNIELTPTALTNLGVVHYHLRDFDRSVAIHRQAVELGPGEPLKWINLADALHFAGFESESDAAFRQAAELATGYIEVNPDDTDSVLMLAWAQEMLGYPGAAQQLIEKGLDLQPRNPYVHYYDALIAVQNRQLEQAMDALQRSLEEGFPPGLLAAEPYLDPLRSRSNLDALLDRYRNP